jgi:hypothetical protein
LLSQILAQQGQLYQIQIDFLLPQLLFLMPAPGAQHIAATAATIFHVAEDILADIVVE